jgi:hypothetical protein
MVAPLSTSLDQSCRCASPEFGALPSDERIAGGQARPPRSPISSAGPGSVVGFGARRQSGSTISYILVYRTQDGRQRNYTIGKHGSPWSPDTARQEARRVLGEVARGVDPLADKIARRKAITVAELCRQYLADVEAGRLLTRRKIAKKESTLISDRGPNC